MKSPKNAILVLFFLVYALTICECKSSGGKSSGGKSSGSKSSGKSSSSGGSSSGGSRTSFSWSYSSGGSAPRYSYYGTGRSYYVYHSSSSYNSYIYTYLWLGSSRTQSRSGRYSYYSGEQCGMTVLACSGFNSNASSTDAPSCSEDISYLNKITDAFGAVIFSDVSLAVTATGGAVTADGALDFPPISSGSPLPLYAISTAAATPFFASSFALELPVGGCDGLAFAIAPSASAYISSGGGNTPTDDLWLLVTLSTAGVVTDANATVRADMWFKSNASSPPLLFASVTAPLANITTNLTAATDGGVFAFSIGASMLQTPSSATTGVLAIYMGEVAVFDDVVSVQAFNWSVANYSMAWSSSACPNASVDSINVASTFCFAEPDDGTNRLVMIIFLAVCIPLAVAAAVGAFFWYKISKKNKIRASLQRARSQVAPYPPLPHPTISTHPVSSQPYGPCAPGVVFGVPVSGTPYPQYFQGDPERLPAPNMYPPFAPRHS